MFTKKLWLVTISLLALALPANAQAHAAVWGGQTPTSPIMVVDSKGAVVGEEATNVAGFSNDQALRKINNQWMWLPVDSAVPFSAQTLSPLMSMSV
jgi:hypothetical protein